MASALEALGARAAGGLQHGEAYDDPAGQAVARLLYGAGGDAQLAAKAAWNQRERARKRVNSAGGQSLLQVENETRFGKTRGLGGDAQALQVATRLGNLAASNGKTQGAYGAAPAPVDPRMTTQGRAEYGRIAQARQATAQEQKAQALNAATTEARNIAERTRLATEGDAWLANMRRQQSAMGALAAR